MVTRCTLAAIDFDPGQILEQIKKNNDDHNNLVSPKSQKSALLNRSRERKIFHKK